MKMIDGRLLITKKIHLGLKQRLKEIEELKHELISDKKIAVFLLSWKHREKCTTVSLY